MERGGFNDIEAERRVSEGALLKIIYAQGRWWDGSAIAYQFELSPGNNTLRGNCSGKTQKKTQNTARFVLTPAGVLRGVITVTSRFVDSVLGPLRE